MKLMAMATILLEGPNSLSPNVRYPRMFVIPKCSLSPKIRRELIYPPQANSFSPNVRYPQNQFAEGNIHLGSLLFIYLLAHRLKRSITK